MRKKRKISQEQHEEEQPFFDFSHDAVFDDRKQAPFFAPTAQQATENPKKVVQQKGGNQHVGGDTDKMTFLPNPVDHDIAIGPGEGGFSRQMLNAAGEKASEMTDFYADKRLRNILPNFGSIDKQTKIISALKQKAEGELDTWFTPIKSVREHYSGIAKMRQANLDTIENDRAAQEQKFTRYNAWVPRANGYYSATLRLDGMMDTLGVSNPLTMKTALIKGIGDAQQIGLMAQQAFDKGEKGSEMLPTPPVDNTVNEASKEAIVATQEMNAAYLGFQTTLLAERKKTINAEGDADRSRLDQINEIKQTVAGIGKTIDLTMSVVQGAPGAIASASDKVSRVGAQYGAMRNRRAVLNGKKQVHNPTYLTVDDDGNTVVRNMQTNIDTGVDDDGKVTKKASPDPEITLPTSIGGALETITDFAYYFEVRDINRRLEQIKNRCDAVDNASELVTIKQKVETFQTALNHFAQKCNALQKRIAQRRQDYLEFGVALDRFAQNSKVAKTKGIGTEKGGERYATILTLTGQIREIMSLGEGVKDSMDSPRQLYDWVNQVIENRNIMPKINMTADEGQPMVDMYDSVNGFNRDVNNFSRFFGDLDTATAGMFAALHQGSTDKGEGH
jgi:hypothetical protein